MAEDAAIKTSDGVNLHGWFIKAEKEIGTLLFFHGNAGNISGRLFKIKGWVDRGFSVLLFDYRSYGLSEGTITHGEDIITDAEAALAWLREKKQSKLDHIVLYGESLGTYPAVRLAVKYRAAALILEAGFTSFKDLTVKHYAMIPGMLAESLIADFKFPNIEYIVDVQSPVFIIHGNRDEICPYEMSEKIFELAPEPKGFLSVPDGMHNDLPIKAGDDFWQKPYEFVVQRREKKGA